MMPYDENVNRFEAARKSFQWMERSKPSVAARGDVDLPSDSRRLFEAGDLPEGIAVPRTAVGFSRQATCPRVSPCRRTSAIAAERIRCAGPTATTSQHGAGSTKHNFRPQAADLSTVCGLFPVCGRFFCRIVYIRPVLCYTIYYEFMRSPRRTQRTPAA